MHILEAIIAKEETIKCIEERYIPAKSIQLSQGYAMVPLTSALKDDIDGLGGSEQLAYDCFEKLSRSICKAIEDTTRPYEIAYIETEYFGGAGEQAALVWRNGDIVFGPSSLTDSDNPINDALKSIGVRVITEHDEFDEMNLSRERDTEEW